MDRVARRGARRARTGACALPDAAPAGARPRAAGGRPRVAQHRLHQHASRPSVSRGSPATSTSSAASGPTSAGTPRSWCRAPTARASRSAGTSPLTSPRPACTRSASTTSSAARTTPAAATRSSSRGTRSPGIYARAFLEGRLSEDQLDALPPGGVARRRQRPVVYPHPRLMPDFWEFPTVSMGLDRDQRDLPGAVQPLPARNRGIKDTSQQHVWAFLGDGEMGEPESLGAIGVAAREELDNLTFVINCNLQQLDGPVRGNGKVIQELESYFRGAGWNVIKVIWGREWDALLAQDVDGVAGQQDEHHARTASSRPTRSSPAPTSASTSSAATRGCARWSRTCPTSDLRKLPRGGHDYRKVYAAFKAATEHVGQPTVILAQTIKGWTIEALRGPQRDPPDEEAHQGRPQGVPRPAVPPDLATRRSTRTTSPPYYHPGKDSDEIAVHAGAPPPARRLAARARGRPHAAEAARRRGVRRAASKGSGKQPVATTMAFVRLLRDLMKDPEIGHADRADRARRVPHVRHGLDVPDGEDLLPARADVRDASTASCCCPTRSREQGQMLHEGISEAGAMALGDRGRHGVRHPRRADDPGLHLLLDVRLPAHRRLDLGARRPARPRLPDRRHRRAHHADRRGPAARRRALAAARRDQPGGRALRPGVRLRDRHIVQDGLRRMYGSSDEHPHGEDVFYYLTVYNEPIVQPAEPEGVDVEGILRGHLPLRRRHRRGGDGTPRGAAARLRRRHAVGAEGAARCSPRSGAWPPTSGR